MFKLNHLILLFLFLTLDRRFPIRLPCSDKYLETVSRNTNARAGNKRSYKKMLAQKIFSLNIVQNILTSS